MVEQELPLEDLRASRADRRLQARERGTVDRTRETECVSCPACGDDSALAWFYFVSPPWTWQHLCGRAGVVAFCDRCERQVRFFLHVMN
jgi:hypothetical protein